MSNKEQEEVLGVGGWILTFILMIIPLVNIIAYIAFVFGAGKSKTRCNFFRAMLVLILIAVVLIFVFASSILAALSGYMA